MNNRKAKTTIVGLISGAIAVLAASHHTSLLDAVKDVQVQLALVGMALGIYAKDYDSHTTTTVEVQPHEPPEMPTTTVEVKE